MRRTTTFTFVTLAALLTPALAACQPSATSAGSSDAASRPAAAKPATLAHGEQSGFANCVIIYTDGGDGSATFTADVRITHLPQSWK
jgi:hypothetical protein